jgi:hypothetical protein
MDNTFLAQQKEKLIAESVERACRAHWPSWDRMRLDHQRKWREKMRAALRAAYLG